MFFFNSNEKFYKFVERHGLKTYKYKTISNENIFIRSGNRQAQETDDVIDYFDMIACLLNKIEKLEKQIEELETSKELENRINQVWDQTSARVDVLEKIIREGNKK